MINGQYVGIEVNGVPGRQSEHQRAFQLALEAAGGMYILAYSLSEFVERLEELLARGSAPRFQSSSG